jgi:hypothetical protein
LELYLNHSLPTDSAEEPLKMKASLAMLLKTNVEKMSVSLLATMFMKTGILSYACHDVDEKKGERR